MIENLRTQKNYGVTIIKQLSKDSRIEPRDCSHAMKSI